MAYERRTFAGGGVATTLNGNIGSGDTTIVISDATGWPTGSAGDFFVVIDRGQATEEKVLIDTRATLSLTVAASGRGSDGTTAAAHVDNATIELCVAARDLDEPNAHIANTGLDHHTQYLNTTRHDVEARHTFGAAYGTPTTPAAVSTSASTGSGNNPAREDHVHILGSNSVIAASIAANAVTTAKLLDANVTEAKLAAAVVAKLASITSASVTSNQSTTSTPYTDLSTVGPSVTLTTGTSVLVIVGCFMSGSLPSMSYAISGATTRAASSNWGLSHNTNILLGASRVSIASGLTPGSNTFTAKYSAGSGTTCDFGGRDLIVISLG